MVKTKGCLKRCFQIFNIILGIVGGIILALAVFSHGAYHVIEEGDGMLPGIVLFYVTGAVVIALAVLGIYGLRKEKKWPLILCFTGMLLLSITFFVIAGRAAVTKNVIEETMGEHFQSQAPLDMTEESLQKQLEVLQREWECCGLKNGYQDWGEHIADSCHCPNHYKNTSECIQVHHRTANVSEELVVYSQPCVPLLVKFVSKALTLVLGIMFGFAFFMLFDAVMAMALLWQMRRQRKATPMTFSVNASEPDYREFHDTAESV